MAPGRFSLARLSVNNPVLVNLVMLAVMGLGTVALIGLPRELFPEIDMQWVFIIKPYPGISPEEIEKLITKPIEDEIQDVEGIDTITSQSAEGSCFISVKFKEMSSEEFATRLQDLRTEVDKVQGLPEDALDTKVESFSTSDMMPIISAHLHGDLPTKKLMELSKTLREELLDIPGIGKAQLTGVRDREVWVEADPVKLEGHGLSIQQIQAAIGAHGLDIPAGSLATGRQELFVRTVGEYGEISDIEKVIIRTTALGQTVRVGDVAEIREDFEDERTRSRLNKEPAVSLTITKQTTANVIDVTDEVKRIAGAFADSHGDKLHVSFTQDSSEQVNDVLSKLVRNAWIGFITVLVVLLVVLGFRNAILAAMGIPMSFLICFIFMFNMGESFNGSSLFALVLVLGIVVDDAIIIIENCYRHRQMGKSWKDAAIDGTEEVTSPVFSAIATTIAAFLPLMLMPGIMGKWLRIVPIVVSLALAASLFEALFILPSHFAGWPGRGKAEPRPTPGWLINLTDAYTSGLRFVMRFRYVFLGLILILLAGATAMIPLLGVKMFQGEEINTIQVRVTMPVGTNLDTTAKALEEFEKVIEKLPKSEVRAIHATAGLVMTDTDWVFRTNVGQIWLDLVPVYERNRISDEIMADLRGRLDRISGPTDIEIAKINQGPPVGKPVEVKLKGKYFDQLESAAGEIEDYLTGLDGVMEIGNDFEPGKKEVRFRVDPELAAIHGLSVAQVGMAIRYAIDGVVADKIYDGDEELDVVVRLDAGALERPADLLRLPLLTPTGTNISLGDVAEYRLEYSKGLIRRYKGQRTITVFANLAADGPSSVEVNDGIREEFEEIKRRHPSVSLDFSGEFQEFQNTFAGLVQLFLFGILLMYVILGTQFKSYIQPFVIFFTVPFAFIGAIFGLWISGNPFSLITLYGIVALAGVAVNDAIVLMSFVNSERARGIPAKDAVIAAGRLRLRPILLTSLTTIGGLLPMALGIGGASLTWSPMANTIAWGLGVGTLLTLFMIPAVYLILVDDIPGLFRKKEKVAQTLD